MANGKIVYGLPPVTYNFAVNYKYGLKPGRLDLVSRKRALDGTAYSDAGPIKRNWKMEFTGAPDAQKEAFEAAYDSELPVDLYLDADQALTAHVQFDVPPEITAEAAFSAPGAHTWAIIVEFSEI